MFDLDIFLFFYFRNSRLENAYINGLKHELQYPNQKQIEKNTPGSVDVNASKKRNRLSFE
jgi:hypothetical protein